MNNNTTTLPGSTSQEDLTVVMPKIGESITEATIVRWLKEEGDQVYEDEPLLEVATAKVNSEIPSPVSGYIKSIIAAVDDTIEVGKQVCVITQPNNDKTQPQSGTMHDQLDVASKGVTQELDQSGFFSPAVKMFAKEHRLILSELKSQLTGRGKGGRITLKDLEEYVRDTSFTPHEEKRIKMSHVRKTIASNMVRSMHEAPHATLVQEISVTQIMQHIKKIKMAFVNEQGYKITPTAFIAHAIVQAAKAYPLISAKLEDHDIIIQPHVHLGIAVNVGQDVLVPVIHNAERMNVDALAFSIHDLSQKAKAKSLDVSLMENGSLTMTNFGMSGVDIGIPIIRYKEVSIIGIGTIKKKIVVQDDHSFAIEDCVQVSLTFDHRVFDGMYGCSFLKTLKERLENPDLQALTNIQSSV